MVTESKCCVLIKRFVSSDVDTMYIYPSTSRAYALFGLCMKHKMRLFYMSFHRTADYSVVDDEIL